METMDDDTKMEVDSKPEDAQDSIPTVRDWIPAYHDFLKRQGQCSERISKIEAECKQNCGKTRALECPSCHGKILDIILDMFNDSHPHAWYRGRTQFRAELDELVTQAREMKIAMADIGARIDRERGIWYCEKIQESPFLMAALETTLGKEKAVELLAKGDAESLRTVAEKTQEGLDKGLADADSSNVLKRITAGLDASSDTQNMVLEYIFASNPGSGSMMNEISAPPLETLMLQMEKTFNADLATDRKEAIKKTMAGMPARFESIKEEASLLEQLQRANTAAEHDKAEAEKREAERAVKRSALEAASSFPDAFYAKSECLNCSRPVGPDDELIGCALCQVLVMFRLSDKLSRFCSTACYRSGHDKHISTSHHCEAGAKCTQFKAAVIRLKTVVCAKCVEDKTAVVLFCSPSCARGNLPAHNTAAGHMEVDSEELSSHWISLDKVIENTLSSKLSEPVKTEYLERVM